MPIDAIPFPLLIIDSKRGNIVDLNRSAADFYGRSIEELASKSWFELCSFPIEQLRERVLHRSAESPIRQRIRLCDESQRDVEVAFSQIIHKGKDAFACFVRDVSEFAELEKELQESNTDLELAQRMSGIGSWSLDPEVGVPKWSEEIYRIYERSPEDGPLPLEDYSKIYRGKWLELFTSSIAKAIGEGAPYDIELRLELPSGRVKWVHAICVPEPTPDSEGFFLRGTIQDVSKSKQLEADKEQLRAQLAQSQKMESLGRLAGGIAHDFNNMLGVIFGRAEMIFDEAREGSAEKRNAELIIDAAQRSSNLVAQLLAFARAKDSGARDLDVNQSISSIVRMLERLTGDNIELRWKPSEEIAVSRLEPAQLDQIVTNLVVNARDAIRNTGRIEIATHLEDAHKQRFVVITVRDDGLGMSAETMERVFEPFFTTKDCGTGCGLGLSTVYGIVTRNGGEIRLDSLEGKGTTVRVYLPASQGRAPSKADEGDELERDPGVAFDSTILVVEDEPAIRSLTTQLIESFGCRVLSAGLPEEALQLARKESQTIDCLVTDVIMPQMKGPELAEKIRELHPRIRVVFMSGYIADIVDEGVLRDISNHILIKPFNKKQLRKVIEQAFDSNDR